MRMLSSIAKENRFFENDRGLAEYIHDETLNKKVSSLYPSVEIVDGELWGVMTAVLKESLSGEETADNGFSGTRVTGGNVALATV